MESSNLQEETPAFLLSPYLYISTFLSSYGWFVLLGASILYYIWTTILRPKLTRSTLVEDSAQSKKCDEVQSNAMEDSRLKLQQRYDADAKLNLEKIREKEEKKAQKRREMYQQLENTDGHRLGGPSTSASASNDQNSSKKDRCLRTEYLPMMGSGSSVGYRNSRSSRGG